MRDHHTPVNPGRGGDDGAPLAWARAGAFGIVAGGIGVLGHDLMTGGATNPWLLLAGVLLATLVARPLAPLRIGNKTMLAGVAALQTVVHLACIVAADGGGAATHVHAHVGGDAATHGGVPVLAIASMLLVHAAAVGLGAAVLLALEAHAWAGVREIVRQLAGRLTVPPMRRATATPRCAAARATSDAARPKVVHGRAWRLRGPPVVQLAH